MKIDKTVISLKGIRFGFTQDGKEIARVFLYVMKNDLHEEPFGLIEDLFVNESSRGKGLGTKLVNEVISAAKELQCYKVLATSRLTREKVHGFYKQLGFKNYGIEFRIDFDKNK